MDKANAILSNIDIAQELASKNYETVINYANTAQKSLIHNWHFKDHKVLEQLSLASRNILDFWFDSILKKRLWVALVRCGAWIGTLETIEKSVYEDSMDSWLQKRLRKSTSSIKHLNEIVQLLEVKGAMTHGEMVEELHMNHASTLTETIKKIMDSGLIDIARAGKYTLYSLTDAGVRYAKQIRISETRQDLLKNVINEYGLQMDETSLDSYLHSADISMPIKRGQSLKLKIDNEKTQNVKVDIMLNDLSYDKEISHLYFKTISVKEKQANHRMEA